MTILYSHKRLVEALMIEEWPLLERLLLDRYVQVRDDCWLWLGRVNHQGYVRVQVRVGDTRPSFYVHRLVAEAYRGDLHGEQIHHTCANRRCLNPEHLIPVTANENMAEMKARQYYIRRIKELEAQLANCSCNSHKGDTITI